MRCPIKAVSRFAYKGKPKQCPNIATVWICLPHSTVKEPAPATAIAYIKVCAFCFMRIQTEKTKTTLARNAIEAGVPPENPGYMEIHLPPASNES